MTGWRACRCSVVRSGSQKGGPATNATERSSCLPLEAEPSGATVPAAALATMPGVRAASVPAGSWLDGRLEGAVVIVSSGALVEWGAATGGRRPALGVLGPGDGFGYEAFLEPVDRPAPEGAAPWLAGRYRALVASRLVGIPRRAFAAIEPGAAGSDATAAAFDALVRRTRRIEHRLSRTLRLTLEDRLLEELRDLSAAFGRPVPGGRRIELPLTQELLADLTGTVRESVNRALRVLSNRGLVRRTGGTYVVSGAAAGSPACEPEGAASAKRSPSRRTVPARSSAMR